MNKRKRTEPEAKKDKPAAVSSPKAMESTTRNVSVVRRSPRKSSQEAVRNNERGISRLQLQRSGRQDAKVPATSSEGHSTGEVACDVQTDDEVLPDVNMNSPTMPREYKKDDIIWAPYKEVYWPAIVTSVKLPHVRYLFIDHSDKNVFKKHAKLLFSFDDSSKNLELKRLGEKQASRVFSEAYDRVIQYLLKKKQNKRINARRFLTFSNKDDKVEPAKAWLLRLTGSFDDGSDDDDDDKGDEEASNDDEDIIDEDSDCADDNDESNLSDQSPAKQAKIKEILEDLETLPSNMTVTVEEKEEMKKEADQLLEVICSQDCSNYLRKIQSGQNHSSYHSKYLKGERMYSGLGPFALFQDLVAKLLGILDDYCDEFDVDVDYKQNVMLPEAIIYAIGKIKQFKKSSATRYYCDTSKKVGVKDS